MGVQDGVEYALRAAARVIHGKGRRDVHFTFIGDGGVLPSLQRLAGELRLDGHVTFTGRITDDATLVSYLATADLCLTPDPQNGLNEHCTMIKTLEYMAMGKAQVAFDLQETRFSAQEAALYARPNDVEDYAAKVLELVDRPQQREEMGRIGLQRIASELSSQHTQAHLLEAYARLFAPQPRGSVVAHIPATSVVSAERE
jgi:glycosyltransferase involved in cell wall biosynthesis